MCALSPRPDTRAHPQVEFSPFEDNKIAVSTAQHFGIIGNGKQYVLELAPGGAGMREVCSFDTRDGVYDCTWSECNENHLVTASGDGSVKMCARATEFWQPSILLLISL